MRVYDRQGVGASSNAATPCRIGWVEHLVAQQLRMEVEGVRALVWRNLAGIMEQTGTASLLPGSFAAIFSRLKLQPQRCAEDDGNGLARRERMRRSTGSMEGEMEEGRPGGQEAAGSGDPRRARERRLDCQQE